MSDAASRSPYVPFITTHLTPDELREELRPFAPWQYEIVFSNGVRTSDLGLGPFFTAEPLAKWHYITGRIPDEDLQGGSALDIGAHVGHYAMFLRQEFDMTVLGIDNDPRNVAAANMLLGLSDLDRVRFACEDADQFVVDEQFDLIVHFGTLDHLPNPYLALKNASAMLRPGGWFALELGTYVDPEDENVCLFVPRSSGLSCCWFLGKGALLAMMAEVGFRDCEVTLEWEAPEVIGERMRRTQVLARTPSETP